MTAAGPAIPFGEWPSPITAVDVARGRLRISFPTVIDGEVWWQEGRPEEGGRVTVVHRSSGGKKTDLLPPPWNARTRVHEYGGLSYLPVPRASVRPSGSSGRAPRGYAILFANYADQRLYVAGPEATAGKEPPHPITPDPVKADIGSGASALRYADFVLSPDRHEVWCVQEVHSGGKVTRAIAAVPLDGSAAEDPGAIRQLVTGSDFFAFPTPSPDGKRLAWISWNHPHMPWDGTELRVAPVSDGEPIKGRLIKGGMSESVLAPVWRDDTSLYVATDWTGWWNIYQVGLAGEPPQALYPAEEEFAGPLWQLGGRPFALLGDGRLAVVHGRGDMQLGLLDPETSELTGLDLPLSEFEPCVSADGGVIAGLAGGPAHPLSVVRIDLAASRMDVLRRDVDDVPDEAYLPVPRQVEVEGKYGRVVHALVYPPTNPDAAGPADERPPYVVWVHGGPTAHSVGLLEIEKAYFTSRGIGVIDVNYGGSTGYGRLYRERLRREWGVVDVEDAVAAARHLAKSGAADPDRLGIRGGSAGGWTALAAVTTGTAGGAVFSAATSYYGVSDLRGLARATHDFESRYLDGLVGPLPGFEGVYTERAPLGHVTDVTCPILLLQGLDDPVVPPEQSQAIAEELAAHGIRHAYIAFEGESHGFRKAETVMTCLDAELSFYGDIFGFKTPGVPEVKLTGGKPVQRPEGGAKGERPEGASQPAGGAAKPARNTESTGPGAESTSKNTEGAGSASGSGAGAEAAGESGEGPDAAARAAGNGGRHRRR
jgi:dipeptidyl aminopeptidase/acylaminoacyl peptidase